MTVRVGHRLHDREKFILFLLDSAELVHHVLEGGTRG